MNIILDFLKTTFNHELQTTMSGDRIASGLLVSFFVTIFVIIVYRLTYQGVSYSRSFCFSLMLLSMVTSVVIMTVTTNLTLSLGMVGALSIVRFRTAVKDPSDTVFMFWAIGVGIMAGAGLIYVSLITNLSLGALYMFYYFVTKRMRSMPYLLMVRYDMASAENVEDVLRSFQPFRVKSKSIQKDQIEVCLEMKMNDKKLKAVEKIASVSGVLDVNVISFRGETTL